MKRRLKCKISSLNLNMNIDTKVSRKSDIIESSELSRFLPHCSKKLGMGDGGGRNKEVEVNDKTQKTKG